MPAAVQSCTAPARRAAVTSRIDVSDDLNWDELRYFVRAIQAGTLSGAARVLGVEHSTIGRRLTRLEQSLGAALVVRAPDGLKLTRLGAKLLPLVESVDQAVATVRNAADAEKACVRLAVPSGFTKMFTAGIPDLRREHPGLSLAIVSGARPVDLKHGEADLALRTGPVTEASCALPAGRSTPRRLIVLVAPNPSIPTT